MDGTEYELEFTFPLTREFETNSAFSCTVLSGSLVVEDHDGEAVISTSEPWSYDGTSILSFSSEDETLEGKYYWASISTTFYLLLPGDELIIEEEEEDTESIFDQIAEE